VKEINKEQDRRHIILEKPLPEILDDIERSIEISEAAAAEARKAAEEARLAGEKAAEEVMRRIRKIFLKMSHDITEELKDSDKKI
jgi:hypothetical protein